MRVSLIAVLVPNSSVLSRKFNFVLSICLKVSNFNLYSVMSLSFGITALYYDYTLLTLFSICTSWAYTKILFRCKSIEASSIIEAWIAGTWVLIRMECLLVINFIQMQETYVGWLLMRSPFSFRELLYLTCKTEICFRID